MHPPLKISAVWSPAFRRSGLPLLLTVCLQLFSLAAEIIPPTPTRYFNDYANVVSTATATELNTQLEQFEKDTSSQILIAIFPKMQSDSSVQDYTLRVAQAWKVGQKDKRNGAILFVFISDRQMFLQVGYGLEGAIPDATAKDITEYVIKPHFKQNDYDGGLRAGVNAILQAARGEYKGTGRTVNQNRSRRTSNNIVGWIPLIFGLFFFFSIIGSLRRSRRHGRLYRRGGWGSWGPVTWGGGGWGGGGSSGGGSWGSSSSSGGFSSGGGDFGGGGAGSSW